MPTPYGRSWSNSTDKVTFTTLSIPTTFTICFWVSYRQPSDDFVVYEVNSSSQNSAGYNDTNDEIYINPHNGPGDSIFDGDLGSNGTYRHVAVAQTGSNMYIYVNGSLVSTTSNSSSSTFNALVAGNFQFGSYGTPDFEMADLRIYDTDLSATQISGIHTNGVIDSSPLTTNLLHRWFLGDDNVEDQYGSKNGTNTGTVQGTDIGRYVAPPATPVANTPTHFGATYFTASWSSTVNDDSYQLDVSTASNFSSFVSGYENLAVNSSSFTVVGLTENTTYYYRVRTVASGTIGSNSNVVTLTTNAYTTPVVPTATEALNVTSTSFSANWSTDLDTVSYRLDVSLNSGFTSFLSGYEDLTVASPPSSLTGLTQYTNYYYRVRGVNPAGTSANSNTINVFTELNVNENSTYGRYLLGSPADIAQLETIEISHSNFAATHYFVRNHTEGVTVTLENGNTQAFSYLPMKITEKGTGNDLDFGLLIEFGDLGELLPIDFDAVVTANGLFTEPTLIYRTYRSDDLTIPMVGPIQLSIKSFSFNQNGATFEAGSDNTNSQTTGELYTVSRFPMLRAFT